MKSVEIGVHQAQEVVCVLLDGNWSLRILSHAERQAQAQDYEAMLGRLARSMATLEQTLRVFPVGRRQQSQESEEKKV